MARKAFVAMLVLVRHLFALHWLLQHPRLPSAAADPALRFELRRLQPQPREIAIAAPTAAAPASGPAHATARTATPAASPARPADEVASGPAGEHRPHGQSAALDLSIPADVAAGEPVQARKLWERPPPIEHRSTRFDRAWMPDGGPVQQTWAFRSKLAAFLLGATGALDLPCSEEERRQLAERRAGRQYPGQDPPGGPGRH